MKLKNYLKGWGKLIAAGLLTAFAISAAFALSVDQTRNFSKRDESQQALHYFRLTVNFNDANIGLGQQFGALGVNSYIHSIDCYVTTAFNAATTNVITFGYTKVGGEIVASGISGNPLAVGAIHLTSAVGLGLAATSAADIPLWVKYTQTGTAATTGSITCVIAYAPNNDM
jgi:hypothetical protein